MGKKMAKKMAGGTSLVFVLQPFDFLLIQFTD